MPWARRCHRHEAVVRGLAGRVVSARSISGWQPSRAAFAGRGRRGLGVAAGGQVSGLVEQPLGQVVGGGVLAQPGDCGGESRAGVRVAVGGGQAGAGQVAARPGPRAQCRGRAASGFMYMLEADLVKEIIEVWSEWREGRTPTLAEAVGAVIWYAEHDAYQRTDPHAGGSRVRVWP
jgi:hypothetical protein